MHDQAMALVGYVQTPASSSTKPLPLVLMGHSYFGCILAAELAKVLFDNSSSIHIIPTVLRFPPMQPISYIHTNYLNPDNNLFISQTTAAGPGVRRAAPRARPLWLPRPRRT